MFYHLENLIIKPLPPLINSLILLYRTLCVSYQSITCSRIVVVPMDPHLDSLLISVCTNPDSRLA